MWLSFAGSVLIACSIIGVEAFRQRDEIREIKRLLRLAEDTNLSLRIQADRQQEGLFAEIARANAAAKQLAEIGDEAGRLIVKGGPSNTLQFLYRLWDEYKFAGPSRVA